MATDEEVRKLIAEDIKKRKEEAGLDSTLDDIALYQAGDVSQIDLPKKYTGLSLAKSLPRFLIRRNPYGLAATTFGPEIIRALENLIPPSKQAVTDTGMIMPVDEGVGGFDLFKMFRKGDSKPTKLNNIEKGKLLDDELEKIANNPELLAEVEKLNNIEFSKFLESRIGFAPQTENLSKKRRAFNISNPADSTKNIIKEKGEDFFKDKTPSEIQQYLKQEKGIEMGDKNIMLYFPFKRVKRTNVQNTVNDALLKLDSYDNLRLEDIKNLPGIKELGLSDDGLRSAIKRARKNVEGIPDDFKLLKSKGDKAMSFQTKYNPALDKRLDYVKDLNELYYKKEGRNIKDGPIKVIKAHILGQGKIVKKDLLDPTDIQILENKLSYIPDDFLAEGFKNPKFFLTYVGNKQHRKIENRLVNDLVKKYKLLGYNPNTKSVKKFDYVGEEGTKTLKLSDDDKIKLKELDSNIEKYKSDLKKMNAQTVFYNPVTEKLVTYGKEMSEMPSLANVVSRVKKGDLELRDGGIIDIFKMTRPVDAQR
jgi:hypothetical protein